MKFVRRTIIAALVVVLLLAAYPLWLGYQIWDSSHKDEVRHADAIVVLGAAQYDGTPSPVFQARLDHAAYLYNQDLSQTIIVTGGKQPGDRFTESQAGARYLESRGIPSKALLGEDRGRTTFESLTNVKKIADAHSIESLLLVSDPLHSERIKRMSHDLGFADAYTSPDSYVDLNRSRLTKVKELVHEVGSVIAYELLDR
jgi:uncharacterized SAM-binding protein YcdF (DUF218 family)